MQMIYTAINEADGLIVATPIYFAEVTAQTKTWLDRMFPYINMHVQSLLPKGKTASFIFTQNQNDPTLFTAQINIFMNMLRFIGFEVRDSMIASNLDYGNKPMANEQEIYMTKAYEIGRHLLGL
jgi:multimeric flavodoxin WrbA